MPEAQTVRFDRNLRKVFWPGDREFVSRVARLCVLYEDLRVEYHGARELGPIEQIDQLSKMYRQFYFLRRSLVLLIEFQGALSRINTGKWKNWIEQDAEPELRRQWKTAIRFFNENCKLWDQLRGDLGGHYAEVAARYAVDNLNPGATGVLEATQIGDEKIGDLKLHFCTEPIGVVLRRTMTNQNPNEDEFRTFIGDVLNALTKGWEHAVAAVNVVLIEFLVPRFMQP